MRVAYVSVDPGVPVFGSKGASVHLQAVLRSLTAKGHHVHLVTTRPEGAPPADLCGVQVHAVPLAPSADLAGRERAVQHADAQVGVVLDGLALGPGLDLVYERYSLWGRTATAWARDTQIPSVLEVNAPLVEEQKRHRQLIDRWRALEVAGQALRAAGAVVCVSEPLARWARARGAHPARVFVVPNGADTSRVGPAATEPPRPFTLGFVGTLKPWHGVPDVVRALGLLRTAGRDHRLLVVGDGPEREALARLAHELRVSDAVEMTGAVAPADVPAQLHRMHVAIAPYPATHDFYFSPLKVYEYLAAGLPVVASSVGSLPDLLGHGDHGVLVPPGSPLALATAIAELDSDPERRVALGRAARAVAHEHDWDRVVDRILTIGGVHGATV